MGKIRKIYETILNDIPGYKLSYCLTSGLIDGAFLTIKNYGIDIDKNVYYIFYNVVSEKLSGSKDFEYEFSDNEYEGLINLKKYIN